MPSTSKTPATVLLPDPMPPVRPTLSIFYIKAPQERGCRLFFISCCCGLVQILCPFYGNGAFLDLQIAAGAGLDQKGRIVIYLVDGAVDTSDGHDLGTFLQFLLEFLGQLGFFLLRAYHEEVEHQDHTP